MTNLTEAKTLAKRVDLSDDILAKIVRKAAENAIDESGCISIFSYGCWVPGIDGSGLLEYTQADGLEVTIDFRCECEAKRSMDSEWHSEVGCSEYGESVQLDEMKITIEDICVMEDDYELLYLEESEIEPVLGLNSQIAAYIEANGIDYD